MSRPVVSSRTGHLISVPKEAREFLDRSCDLIAAVPANGRGQALVALVVSLCMACEDAEAVWTDLQIRIDQTLGEAMGSVNSPPPGSRH